MADDDEETSAAMALEVYTQHDNAEDAEESDNDDDDDDDDLVYNDHDHFCSRNGETERGGGLATLPAAAATIATVLTTGRTTNTTTTGGAGGDDDDDITMIAVAPAAAVALLSPPPVTIMLDNDREEEISQQQNDHAVAAAGGEHHHHQPPQHDEPDEEEEDGDDDDDAASSSGNNNNNNHHQNNTYTNKWHQNGYGHVVPKQSGKFSREESDVIKTAIEEYCARKHITVKSLCSEREHKADLKGAWMEIAQTLPERSVQSVYRHGIRQCHPFKRGAWSEAEVSMLQDLVAHNSKKWSMIQTKLNRSADSCRDKYREMSDDYVKGRWEDVETMELITQIRCWLHHHTNGATSTLVDFAELAQLVEELKIQIPWSLISKRMGRRSRLSCFKKWQKLTSEAEVRAAFRTETAVAVATTTTTSTTNAAVVAPGNTTTTTRIAVASEQQRPSKRQKTEEHQQDDDNDADGSQEEEETEQGVEEEAEEATEYIVPMTEAHNNMVVTADEAELAAETVEALGLPDLITSKTTTSLSSTSNHISNINHNNSETTTAPTNSTNSSGSVDV